MTKQHRMPVGQLVEYMPTTQWGQVTVQGLDTAGMCSIYTVQLIDFAGKFLDTYVKAMNYELRKLKEDVEYYE
jgi:hypothetical protein